MWAPRCVWPNFTIITPPKFAAPLVSYQLRSKLVWFRGLPPPTTSVLLYCDLVSCNRVRIDLLIVQWRFFFSSGSLTKILETVLVTMKKTPSNDSPLFNEKKFFISVGVCLPQIFCVFCLRVPSLDFDLYPCQPKAPLPNSPNFWLGRSGCCPNVFVCVFVELDCLWARKILQKVQCSWMLRHEWATLSLSERQKPKRESKKRRSSHHINACTHIELKRQTNTKARPSSLMVALPPWFGDA